jgi:hypothetical protein
MSEAAPEAPATEAPAEQAPEKTFTQADLDRIVQDRVARAKASYSDYDDLKAKASKLDELSERSKTDLERAVEAARKEGAQTATQAANARLVRAEAKALAASAKFRDPLDAVAFLGDLGSVKVNNQGEVDTDSLKTALAELAEAKPYLLLEEKPTRPTGDAGQGPRDDGPLDGAQAMNQLIRLATGRA